MMRKLQLILVSFAGVMIVVILILVKTVELPVKGNNTSISENYLIGWTDEEGEQVSLYHSFEKGTEKHTFTRMINGNTVNGREMCLITHNMSFKVLLGDKVIYSYAPELGGLYGKRYGEALHIVNLPTFSDNRQLSIEAVSLSDDGTSGCDEAYLMHANDFIDDVRQKSGIKFALCVMTFLFGLLLFVVGIVEDKFHGKMIETMCLGAIAMIVSAWVGSQTMILRTIVQNSAMLRVVEYTSLMVLPIPVLMFVAAYTRNCDDKRVMSLIIASALNTILTVSLVCMGLGDYYDYLFITHIIIATGVCLIIHIVVISMLRNKIDRRKSIYLVSALTVLMLSGILDMVMYYVENTNGTAYLTVIGLIVFASILAVYEYQHIIEIQIMSSKAELMQTLAMKDPLTDIGSRTAFVAHEKSLMEKKTGKCLFVHFDVNNLKHVNDVYGHAEGDRIIIGAANVIKAGFSDYGKVYRVGGDEFFAILEQATCQEDYNLGIAKFTRAQLEYNAKEELPVQLSIAYGMAEYNCNEQNPENAERLADSRMYEKKREMKAASLKQKSK